MRSINFNKTLNMVVLALAVLLLGASVSVAQQQVNLTAAPTSLVMPDGQTAPMWGYSCGAVVSGSTAACATLNQNAGTGWSPVVITVPTGQGLQINLTNNLSFTPAGSTTPNNIPTSIVIVGQVGGGLGDPKQEIYAASPTHAQQQVTWPIANTGAVNSPPPQGQRVQSFATEVAATPSTTATPTALTWSNLKPGTYLLESGTHPSIQVPMGLIGVLVVTTAPVSGTTPAAGTAYPGVTYDADVPLEFSEIDPVQNAKVTSAVTTAGFVETATWVRPANGGITIALTNGGSGYSSTTPPNVTIAGGGGSGAVVSAVVSAAGAVTGFNITSAGNYQTTPTITIDPPLCTPGPGCVPVQATATATVVPISGGPCGGSAIACYPPAVNYTPLYYLINGVAFSRANAGVSVFPATIPSTPLTGSASGLLLVRTVNAGLRMHVPAIVGSFTPHTVGATTTSVPGFSIIAEDGNLAPGTPKVQTDVFMAAGKTFDLLITGPTCTPVAPATTCTPSAIPVFDRELSLSGNSSERDAGMLAYIGVNGAGAPAAVGNGAAVARPDSYASLVPCTTAPCTAVVISDASKGVIANDTNVYGVQLLMPPASGTLSCGMAGIATNGLCANGSFTYTPNVGTTSDSFTYCANGTVTGTTCSSGLTATVSLSAATIEVGGITLNNITYTANTSQLLKIPSPGILSVDSDAAGYPLKVVVSSVTPSSGLTVKVDPNGGFRASVASAGTYTFTYQAQNSQGTTSSGTATVTLNFQSPNAPTITVVDPKSGQVITDYRWIIEEDKTFYVDPNCANSATVSGTTVTPPANCPANSPYTSMGVPATFGVNFHTSHMEYVAQGCNGPTTGALSCEYGQTVLNPATGAHVPAVCDLASGACDTTASQEIPVDPSQVYLDPGCGYGSTSLACPTGYVAPHPKRYYISVLPGDAANPFNAGNTSGACSNTGGGSTSANCGHTMGGAPLIFNAATGKWNAAQVIVEPSPLPPGQLSVEVFEDDFPLNGEQDAGGGIDVIATNEPGLGQFNIVLWDDMGGSGDVTGQMTYDMFNQPLGNSLDGTIDPATGLNACPITNAGQGITGMIVTCPKYESDGVTESPLVGQAIVSNLMPGRFSVQAYPGADRIARREEWLQTNTLDGQHPHDSFIRIGEPTYFQEYGPAGFHVTIGFANPAIINARYAGVCNGSDLNITATNCTNTVTGKVTAERMSRTPDQRLYSSGSRDAFSWTQCFVSLGDPDGEDFMFTKCNADGVFTFTGVPTGSWRLSIFDQWNDQLMDGLTTPVNVGNGTNQSINMGDVPVQQWQANVYTRSFVDDNKDGVFDNGEIGIPLLNTTVRYRDGSLANNLLTDFGGVANFNETFPLFNWYVVEADTTRYKTTGIHTVYDAGGPADGTSSCGAATSNPGNAPCGNTGGSTSWPYNFMANTYEQNPLPASLTVPGAVYCPTADCANQSIQNGPLATTQSAQGNSTGRIDPGWVIAEGWQGFSGQNNFIEFGKAPYAPGENGGIHGHVVYASTRPFDDPAWNVQDPWEPLVPHVTMNLYQESFASDGVTPILKLVDTTSTTSWDDWAQGFRKDASGNLITVTDSTGTHYVPNMNCPGQSTSDLFFYSLAGQWNYLDLYNSFYNGGTPHTLAANSQFKCYDGMHNWNQLQPAPYDGYYAFPSVVNIDPASGKPAGTGSTNGVAGSMAGTNCTICIANPDTTDAYRVGTPMLPAGKYVVEIIMPPGYELVKEEDKNILIGDNFVAPVTQQFGGLGAIFIMPDQASVASAYDPTGSGYNANNAQNPTQNFGANAVNWIVPGFLEPIWPCVGESRIVPDYMSIFPQSYEVSPFAGATRNLCDRKEVTLGNQMSATAKFYVYTSTHIASKFSGGITDDFTSEFDPFAPVFGEKFAPPNMPVSTKDWAGNEISRVYSDQWGQFNGMTYSTWEVNPPNPTGYSPTMMVQCMNDKGPIAGPGGSQVDDPLYNPLYSQFCYELAYMPGMTDYLDTPVVPTAAFVGAGYNNPDCAYPDATPVVSSVTGDVAGPWVSAAGKTLTINSLPDQMVSNYGYSGPSATTAPFNAKTVKRHYGFGGTTGTVAIGGVPATVNTWSETQITVTVPTGVPNCSVQQQAQYSGSTAQCGQLLITTAGGKQSIDTVTVTIGGKAPTVMTAGQTIQSAVDAAAPGDLIIVPAGTYREMVLMWKPVRLQGVGAASSLIDASPHPAGKLNPWRRSVNCLFGLSINGQPISGGNPYDSLTDTGNNGAPYTCPTPGATETGQTGPNGNVWNYFSGGPNYPTMVVDRIPLEGILGWDATVNGNLAEQLQEPSIMGAYEGAGITVLSKGVNIPAGSTDVFGSGAEAAFPTGSTLLTGAVTISAATGNATFVTGDANAVCHTSNKVATNPFPSNYQCNPSSIDGLGITDSSQGGGGIFVHAWAHNLQIANDRIFNNAGTLSGGIALGQGESPEAYLNGTANDSDPGSCLTPGASQTTAGQFPANTQLPYCENINVNMHNNAVTNNSSTGDELFSGTPAGAGGVSICTGADYYKFNYNWVCGNMSTGDGGGVGHMGFSWNGDIEHNSFLFNQSFNPSIIANGGGLIIMGAAPDATINGVECGSVTDNDCVPGLSDGTGPGLVINANLFQGNSADAGSGGGLRFQSVNGTEVPRFPNNPSNWYAVKVTNNIINNNVAGWDGAGVSLEDALVVNFINNTISSNDSTASAGVLFNTLGAPLASSQSPTPTCLSQNNGTVSCPQVAGLASMPNSPQLTSSFTTGTIKCPAGHFQPGTSANAGTCTKVSYPVLYNNILWQNRSFQIGVGAVGTGQQNQQAVVTLYNAAFNGTIGGAAASQGTTTGTCPAGSSYWDIGIRGDSGPSNHGSGFTLNPNWSVLTDAGDYPGADNFATNPNVVTQFCNGSRVPPENGGLGYNVPPGIADAVVPNPVFSLTPAATVDEGNNWINISWGPLSVTNPSVLGTDGNYGGGPALGNYALAGGSYAIDVVPISENLPGTLTYPTADFFGMPRPDTSNLTAFDIGAVEFQGNGGPKVPTLTAIAPTSGERGQLVNVTLTGTSLTTTTAVNITGTGVTVSNVAVVNDSTVTATFAVGSGATIGLRNVTVTTAGGTSGPVSFTVVGPSISLLSPNTGERGQGVGARAGVSITITGVDLTGATGLGGLGNGITVAANTFKVVSDTQITATLNISSTATAGNRNITVQTPNANGGSTNPLTFTVTGASTSSISPTSGLAGTSVPITINGSDLTGANGLSGLGNGVTVAAGTFKVMSDTQITATLNIGATAAAGNRSITVQTPNANGGATNPQTFAVTRPNLTSISPTSGSRAAGTVAVTLNGTNLTGVNAITISGTGVTASSIVVNSGGTQVTATFTITSTAGLTTRAVSVTNAGGAASNTVSFTVTR